MLGKEFENICLNRIKSLSVMGLMHGSRYGVQVSVISKSEQVVLQSLPDFEGVIPGGIQWITDCKVCSSASFPLNKYVVLGNEKRGPRERQLRHMRSRSRMGAVCFFLIHWNARELSKTSEPEITYAFPVVDNDFWMEVDALERRKITRADCEEHGVRVEWTRLGRERTPRPDILSAIQSLLERYGNVKKENKFPGEVRERVDRGRDSVDQGDDKP